MSKYLLLFILNVPFVFLGLLKALMAYRTKLIDWLTFSLRVIFWLIILAGLIFAEPIYNYLFNHGLTDSTPLSLPDVVLATGLMLSLSLCLSAYSKIEALEKRFSDLHEKISVIASKNKLN